MYKIGILGIGKMGGSILQGIVDSEIYSKEEIILFDTNLEVVTDYKKRDFKFAANIDELLSLSEMTILAIKPQVFPSLKTEITKNKYQTVMISIIAGLSTEGIKDMFGDVKCVRVMPNTPALIKKAVCVISRDNQVTDLEFERIQQIFKAIGTTTEISENKMNEIIPLNGSIPAYLYYFVEGFIQNAIKNGIDKKTAKELVTSSIISSCYMILNTNKELDELINDVCSKGGTTLAGLDILKEANLLEVIDKTCDACIKRAYELAQ